MLGVRFIKAQPTMHLMQFRKGRIVREGAGLSFFYYAPSTTLVAVPVTSQDCGFMLELVTADFQSVTVQGRVSFRVSNPQRIAALIDFSLLPNGKGYASPEHLMLAERVGMQAKVIVQQAVQALDLKEALKSSAAIARSAQEQLGNQTEISALGLQILGVAIVAIKPVPDIARALEATARESNLKAADDAIYLRRMASVQNERSIRQNELDTEIAVEQKKRQIQETQMEAKAVVMRRQNELRGEQMSSDIELEQRRKDLVLGQADNIRQLAEAEAYKVSSLMQAFDKVDARVVQALAATGMQPGQLIAQAFGNIAQNAERIGQLNVSPELLNSLMQGAAPKLGVARKGDV